MARDAEATRQRILKAAYPLFYRNGFARVSVDAIAEAAGVTKKTLYYHFDSKDALVTAVFVFQHDFALQAVQDWVRDPSPNAATVVTTLFERFGRWAAKPTFHGTGFTRITMELADMPGHPARLAARKHKEIVEEHLALRFAALGLRDPARVARQIVLLIEGANVLMLIHGKGDYALAAAAAARLIVTAHQPRNRRR